MSNGTDQTPQIPGTDPVLTPEAGTATGQETDGASHAPAETVDYKTKFAESTREAQRLLQRTQAIEQQNQILQQQLWQMQQQMRSSQQQPVSHETTPTLADDEDFKTFSDGVIDRDPTKIKRVFAKMRDDTKQEVMRELGSRNEQQTRLSSSLNYIASELKDPNAPVAKKAVELYSAMAIDPNYYTKVAPDVVPIGNAQVNPHLMQWAIDRAKAETGARLNRIERDAAEQADSFVEPSRPQPPQQKKFDPMKHLDASERAVALRSQKPGETEKQAYERYWKYLDDPKRGKSLREARLDAGKPLSYKQI